MAKGLPHRICPTPVAEFCILGYSGLIHGYSTVVVVRRLQLWILYVIHGYSTLSMDKVKPRLEWNKLRTGAPFIQQDTRRLAYIEGSDEMFPQPTFGNGASVRYQNLTRNVPPDYAVVTHENKVPFVETARASKPAQWRVYISRRLCGSYRISIGVLS